MQSISGVDVHVIKLSCISLQYSLLEINYNNNIKQKQVSQ